MTNTPTRTEPSKHDKTASRIVIYLIEELGDARLRAAQLQGYVKQATDLIEKSEHRDHIFEVAAHLIQGIPETVFKLGKALDASALAAARLDYEEIKQGLKPEKADELESVMEDNRLRYLKRRSEEEPMHPKQASQALRDLAAQTRSQGHVPTAALMGLIASLEAPVGRTAADTSEVVGKAAECFEKAAEAIVAPGTRPNRASLASMLRRVLADAILAGAGDEFKKHNPSITDEQVAKIDEMHETHKDNLKAAGDETAEAKESRFEEGKPADPTENMSPEDAKKWKEEHDKNKNNFKAAGDETAEDKQSKFEEGKPADPTENMTPEQKAEWEKQNEAHKDQFKTATEMTSQYAFAMAASKVQMAVDAFAYAEDTQGYARGWENLAKGLVILKDFFEPLLKIAANHLDKAADLARKADMDVTIAGYQHLEMARKDLDTAADVARAGNIAGSFKRLASAMEHMAETGKEARWPNFAKAATDAGVIFRRHDTDPLEGKTAGDETAEAKESRFEEGKPADPTENMSPEDAKKWKEEHDKNKDNFKAATEVTAASLAPGNWYKQTFSDGEVYFTPQTQLKNKNWSGLLVRYYGGRPEAAKQTSVSNPGLWSEVKESDVPPKVMAKFKARMASAWKA